MMESIFANTNVFRMSDPQPAWLFTVSFFNAQDSTVSSQFAELVKTTLIPTSVTLPTFHTDIVTKNWFGTEKSYPVIRKYGGDCTMNFDVRSEKNENASIYRLTQIGAQFRHDNEDYILYHPELEKSPNGNLHILKFNKIQVRLKNKTIRAEDDDLDSTIYEYKNCIITEFAFNEELDYASDSKLTCKMTFHYDLWHILS